MCGSAGSGVGGGGPDAAKACAGADGGRDSLGAPHRLCSSGASCRPDSTFSSTFLASRSGRKRFPLDLRKFLRFTERIVVDGIRRRRRASAA